MSAGKQYKLAEKAALQQQQMVGELQALVKSIERCEKTIIELKNELEAVQVKHANRKTTQEDVAYLTDLLKCANRKLNWEKQLASLQKRTPSILERMSTIVNDPTNPPSDDMRATIVGVLQGVQAAMQRLEKINAAAAPDAGEPGK